MTMNDQHVTASDVQKLARRALAPADVLRVARHVGECAKCAALGQEPVSRDDVDEAFGLDEVPRRSPRVGIFVGALAAAAAAAFVTFALIQQPAETPSPIARRTIATRTPFTYDRADWNTAVADAVRNGNIAAPNVLRSIRTKPDVLRGATEVVDAKLAPAGVVLDETTPHFTWTAFKNAQYLVDVYEGETAAASSGVITSNDWTPQQPLRRGATYTWQIEIRRSGKSIIVPAPPLPEARFHILDAKTSVDLADARRRFPNDHLLLGVLAARAGLQTVAEDELRASSSPAAPRILESIRNW